MCSIYVCRMGKRPQTADFSNFAPTRTSLMASCTGKSNTATIPVWGHLHMGATAEMFATRGGGGEGKPREFPSFCLTAYVFGIRLLFWQEKNLPSYPSFLLCCASGQKIKSTSILYLFNTSKVCLSKRKIWSEEKIDGHSGARAKCECCPQIFHCAAT